MVHRHISRRRFLESAVCSVGLVASSPLNRTTASIRIGIIGCGVRGSQLIRALAQFRNIHITAICDRDRARAETAARTIGAAVYDNWEDVVSSGNIDGIVLATPDYLRAHMTLAALNHDKDVLSVPPLAMTVTEAEKICQEVHLRHRVFQMVIPVGCDPVWDEVLRLASNNAIGQLLWAQGGTRCSLVGSCNDDTGGKDHWRNYPALSFGKPATDFFGDLTMLLALRPGEIPAHVGTAGGHYEVPANQNPDALVLTCRYRDGFTLALSSTAYTSHFPHPTVIRGTEGTIEYSEGRAILRRDSDGERQEIASRKRTTFDGLSFVVTDWLKNIRMRGKCIWNADRCLMAQHVLCRGLETLRPTVA